MPVIWHMLPDLTRKKLQRLQARRYHSELNPPPGDPRLVTAPLETVEEIGQIMREPPSSPEKVK